jgi:hypothetical protein
LQHGSHRIASFAGAKKCDWHGLAAKFFHLGDALPASI